MLIPAGLAAAEETPFHLEDPARWGTLVTVVRPDYPKEALSRGQTGAVDITGVVLGTGFLNDIEYRPDRPESAVFVEALKELVPDWQFYPPLGNDCLPTTERITTRMHFEIDAGKPRIFAEHAKRSDPREEFAKLKPTKRVNPRYPTAALNRRHMARVYAMLEIDPAGKVSNVRAKAFSAQARRDRELSPFVDSTLYWLSQWEFEPLAEGDARARRACLDVDFRIPN
jgi:hypothetical protein